MSQKDHGPSPWELSTSLPQHQTLFWFPLQVQGHQPETGIACPIEGRQQAWNSLVFLSKTEVWRTLCNHSGTEHPPSRWEMLVGLFSGEASLALKLTHFSTKWPVLGVPQGQAHQCPLFRKTSISVNLKRAVWNEKAHLRIALTSLRRSDLGNVPFLHHCLFPCLLLPALDAAHTASLAHKEHTPGTWPLKVQVLWHSVSVKAKLSEINACHRAWF